MATTTNHHSSMSAKAHAVDSCRAWASGRAKPGACAFPAPNTVSDARMKAAILALIQSRQDVSFAELARDVPGFAASDPAESFDLGTDKTGVILWSGLSRQAFNAMRALQADGRIRARASGVLPYLIDGITLSLKVAKPARSYKRTRWLPVTWRTT